MPKLNENYKKLQNNYLFAEIARRVNEDVYKRQVSGLPFYPGLCRPWPPEFPDSSFPDINPEILPYKGKAGFLSRKRAPVLPLGNPVLSFQRRECLR